MMLSEQQIAEGWLPHDGGPCPVHAESTPGVMLRSGAWREPKACFSAGDYKWEHDSFNPRYDIIAYKPEPNP